MSVSNKESLMHLRAHFLPTESLYIFHIDTELLYQWFIFFTMTQSGDVELPGPVPDGDHSLFSGGISVRLLRLQGMRPLHQQGDQKHKPGHV